MSAAILAAARRCLDAGQPTIDVLVSEVQGSAPREAGTHMLVTAQDVIGTIGGGHLEWAAIRHARAALTDLSASLPSICRYALGPSLGQCCGGVVHLKYEALTEAAFSQWHCPPPQLHLQLHGAGHVGRAIAHILRDVDCRVQWIDERETEFPTSDLRPHIQHLCSDIPMAEVASAPAGACYVVMTHSHDLDLNIVDTILRRGDARYVGLIGSSTKRARMLHRLMDRGHSPTVVDRLICPIGLPGIVGKSPPVLALSVVAQLLSLPAPTREHPR